MTTPKCNIFHQVAIEVISESMCLLCLLTKDRPSNVVDQLLFLKQWFRYLNMLFFEGQCI